MTFIPRDLPQLIEVDGQVILGPFCVWCGNPEYLHRAEDSACPKRRMSEWFPKGKREENCTCMSGIRSLRYHNPHEKTCPVYVHHPNPTADAAFAKREQKKLDRRQKK